jgi:hypothetical protein
MRLVVRHGRATFGWLVRMINLSNDNCFYPHLEFGKCKSVGFLHLQRNFEVVDGGISINRGWVMLLACNITQG